MDLIRNRIHWRRKDNICQGWTREIFSMMLNSNWKICISHHARWVMCFWHVLNARKKSFVQKVKAQLWGCQVQTWIMYYRIFRTNINLPTIYGSAFMSYILNRRHMLYVELVLFGLIEYCQLVLNKMHLKILRAIA